MSSTGCFNPWEIYQDRAEVHGVTRRAVALRREKRNIREKLRHNLSYQHALVDDAEQEVAIVSTDNLNIKHIYSMPDEDIRHGSYVYWMDNYWLVTEKDYATEVYTKATIQQCNYLLKWIDEDDNIIEQWCIVEDGTKLFSKIVSVQRNLYAKILIELLESPKAHIATA